MTLDPAIQQMISDFRPPKKPDGWKHYKLQERHPGLKEELRAIMDGDIVKVVHQTSRGDYHVQTEIYRTRNLNPSEKFLDRIEGVRGQAPYTVPALLPEVDE